MMKAIRILEGIFLCVVLLYLAVLATQDCAADIYSSENCLWLRVREYTGLPPSRLLRAVAFELVGLTILAGLYATIRYVFPSSDGEQAFFSDRQGHVEDRNAA